MQLLGSEDIRVQPDIRPRERAKERLGQCSEALPALEQESVNTGAEWLAVHLVDPPPSCMVLFSEIDPCCQAYELEGGSVPGTSYAASALPHTHDHSLKLCTSEVGLGRCLLHASLFQIFPFLFVA
mmetsp:Transcript_39207/g.83483  ORF Transcript_39207/g.83483 Transcript_39207/m.83483 type:complete len:126 (-) Transcript_39207:323-700(-)